jgi:hypothetical protein
MAGIQVKRKVKALFFCLVLINITGYAQSKTSQSFFAVSDSFSKIRYNGLLITGAVTYTTFSYGLYNTWYKNQDLGSFRFFNDGGEWLQMDKVGHLFSSYFQTSYFYKAGRWSGISKRKSLIASSLISTIFQSTLEVYDGFAKKWGFSLYDVGANLSGVSIFVVQQVLLNDQYVLVKESSFPKRYNSFNAGNQPSQLIENRANDLFGKSLLARALKDYNVQTYWLSTNPSKLKLIDDWPKWLNIAVGYGADGMFGGYENEWRISQNERIKLTTPRVRQLYLSLDLNLNEIKVKNPFLRMIMTGLNIVKVPAPAIEYNKSSGLVFHFLHF